MRVSEIRVKQIRVNQGLGVLHKVQILINGPYMLQLSIMTHDLCLLGDQRDFLVRFPSPVSTARNFNEIQMF